MKRIHRSVVALLLSLLLAAQGVMPARAAQNQPRIEGLAPVSTVVADRQLLAAGPMPGDTLDYVTTIEEAAQLLRQGLQNRQEEIVVPILSETADNRLMYDVLNAALAHTGNPTQGDYLRWQLGTVWMGLSGYSSGSENYLKLTYTAEYYTTADQEAQMDAAVDALLDQLDVYDAGDYEKVCAIYDYMCNYITYDYAGLEAGDSKLIYTAYAALINGMSVCQGYANLFYRLALELDVDARLIPGTGSGEEHGWNIVKLDGKYYNLDATWDASRAQAASPYQYFLRGQESFPDHTRDIEYNTQAFHNAYPMDAQDYCPVTGPVLGDIDGDEKVNSDDVIRLLLYVSMPSMFPITAQADFTDDGRVTSDDVIRLLLYVSMPNMFPLK